MIKNNYDYNQRSNKKELLSTITITKFKGQNNRFKKQFNWALSDLKKWQNSIGNRHQFNLRLFALYTKNFDESYGTKIDS